MNAIATPDLATALARLEGVLDTWSAVLRTETPTTEERTS